VFKYILKKYQSIISFIRHPFGITCLKCGFLSVGDHEVDTSSRILLDCRGSAGNPRMDLIKCYKSLWVNLDLEYFPGPPADEIFDMVTSEQRQCKGYLKYRPGWSPKDLLIKHQDLKDKIIMAIIGGIIGLFLGIFGKWLSTRIGIF
jgi:hypothetical protein